MPLTLTKNKVLPIGIDLGTSAAKVAQLRLNEAEVELVAAAHVAVPPESRADLSTRARVLVKGLQSSLKGESFKGRQCVLSIPADDTFVQHVKLSSMPEDDIAHALELELNGKLPYPTTEAIIRHIVAGKAYDESGKEKLEVIAVCAARRTLEQYLSLAGKAGLDVVGVNIEPFAIVECFSRLFRRSADEERTILFIDLGAKSTQVVMSHGSRIVFARNLKVGGDQFDAVVAEGLDIPVDQANSLRQDLIGGQTSGATENELYHLLDAPLGALTDELTQCLQYYESVFRNQSIERAIFVGGQAYDKRLCQTIAQRLNLPAQIGDPLVRVKRLVGAGLGIGLDRREAQPGWAVAVGLSLGAAA